MLVGNARERQESCHCLPLAITARHRQVIGHADRLYAELKSEIIRKNVEK